MIHGPDCSCSTYGCELRRKGLQVSPSATPNRRNHNPPRRAEVPGQPLVYQDRPGGTKMPILRPDGTQYRRKQYLERKHEINDKLARVQAGKL